MGSREVRAGRAFVEIVARDGLSAGLARAAATLRGFSGMVAGLGAAVTGVTGTIFGGLAAAVQQFSSAGDAIEKMAGRTGLSAEAVSELAYAADLSGTNVEDLEKGVRKMQQTIAAARDGNEAALESLRDLGVNMASLADTPDAQLAVFAERIAAIEDPAARTAAAMSIFGKAGTQLLPLMADGAEGLRAMREEAAQLGLTVSTDTAARAAKLNDALGRVAAAAKAVTFNLGAAVAPAVTEFANRAALLVGRIVNWIKTNEHLVVQAVKVVGIVGGVGVALTAVGVAGLAASYLLTGLSQAVIGLASPFLLAERLARATLAGLVGAGAGAWRATQQFAALVRTLVVAPAAWVAARVAALSYTAAVAVSRSTSLAWTAAAATLHATLRIGQAAWSATRAAITVTTSAITAARAAIFGLSTTAGSVSAIVKAFQLAQIWVLSFSRAAMSVGVVSRSVAAVTAALGGLVQAASSLRLVAAGMGMLRAAVSGLTGATALVRGLATSVSLLRLQSLAAAIAAQGVYAAYATFGSVLGTLRATVAVTNLQRVATVAWAWATGTVATAYRSLLAGFAAVRGFVATLTMARVGTLAWSGALGATRAAIAATTGTIGLLRAAWVATTQVVGLLAAGTRLVQLHRVVVLATTAAVATVQAAYAALTGVGAVVLALSSGWGLHSIAAAAAAAAVTAVQVTYFGLRAATAAIAAGTGAISLLGAAWTWLVGIVTWAKTTTLASAAANGLWSVASAGAALATSTWAAAVAILNAMLSPTGILVGVVVAAVAGLGALLYVNRATIIDSFRQSLAAVPEVLASVSAGFGEWVASVKAWFSELVRDAAVGWEGISAALAIGEWRKAWDIAWTQIQLTFFRAVQPLQLGWSEFTTGLASLLDGAIVAVRTSWNNVTTWIASSILKLMGMLQEAIAKVAEFDPTGMAAELSASLSVDVSGALAVLEEQRKRFDQDLNRAREARDSERAKALADRQQQISSRITALEQTRNQLADAAKQQAGGARIEDKVRTWVEEMLAPMAEQADKTWVDLSHMAARATDGGDSLARAADPIGTFSAQAAQLLSYGFGRTREERMVEIQKEQLAKTDELIRATERISLPVFTGSMT